MQEVERKEKVLDIKYLGTNRMQTPSYQQNQTKQFQFDKVFHQEANQIEVFQEVQTLV